LNNARLEYKYLVPARRLTELRRALQPFVEMDAYVKNPDRAEYTVRSIYLDTPDLECYQEKLDGVSMRKKYRIRGYDQVQADSVVFMEIKNKIYNHILKNRAPLPHRHLQSVLETGNYAPYVLAREINGPEHQSANYFLFYYHRKNLHPVILIVYDREAFFCKFDRSLRLTFDKNVRSIPCSMNAFHQEPLRYAFSQYFIFEVKFLKSVPGWLQTIIHRFDLQRCSASKYEICLDSHKQYGKFLGSPYLALSRPQADIEKFIQKAVHV
jgi:hypothetical protein